jgi:hypothetical protein
MNLPRSQKLVRADDVLVRDVVTCMLLMAASNPGQVTSLSGSGTDIWRALHRPQTPDELVSYLAERYQVEPDDIGHSVLAALDALLAAKLVRPAAA